MNSYSFDFNFVKAGTPIVTINALGLAFNYLSRSKLGFPDRINVGYDDKAHVIGVQAHKKGSDLQYYEFESREKNGWIRIGCKDFVRYLSETTQFDFQAKSKQFIAFYDDETDTLIVIIDEEHEKKRYLKTSYI